MSIQGERLHFFTKTIEVNPAKWGVAVFVASSTEAWAKEKCTTTRRFSTCASEAVV